MLIGKPLLKQIKATHDYSTDSTTVLINTSHHCIHNFVPHNTLSTPFLPTAISLPVHTYFPLTSPTAHQHDGHARIQHIATDNFPPLSLECTLGKVPSLPMQAPHNSIFTRLTKKRPFHPPRVNAILNAVQVSTTLPEELTEVCALLHEFADIFSLYVKEVKLIPTLKYCLNIPDDVTFSVKVNQKSLNQAQKEFYFPKFKEFEDAGVLCPIHVSRVKAVHLTVLAQKAHKTPSLTMDKIR